MSMINKMVSKWLVWCNDCETHQEIEPIDVDESGQHECDCDKLIEWDCLDDVMDDHCYNHMMSDDPDWIQL